MSLVNVSAISKSAIAKREWIVCGQRLSTLGHKGIRQRSHSAAAVYPPRHTSAGRRRRIIQKIAQTSKRRLVVVDCELPDDWLGESHCCDLDKPSVGSEESLRDFLVPKHTCASLSCLCILAGRSAGLSIGPSFSGAKPNT